LTNEEQRRINEIDMARQQTHKLFEVLLLIPFVLLILVSGFHHHNDSTSHSDCSLCIAGHQPAVTSDQNSSLLVSQDAQIASLDWTPTFVSLMSRTAAPMRGPPA
jgi:hypothetical protein